jgi:hypothetical protein
LLAAAWQKTISTPGSRDSTIATATVADCSRGLLSSVLPRIQFAARAFAFIPLMATRLASGKESNTNDPGGGVLGERSHTRRECLGRLLRSHTHRCGRGDDRRLQSDSLDPFISAFSAAHLLQHSLFLQVSANPMDGSVPVYGMAPLGTVVCRSVLADAWL